MGFYTAASSSQSTFYSKTLRCKVWFLKMQCDRKCFIVISKMPTVRNARSLVTSRELPSGLQIWGKRQAECKLFSVVAMNADTDSASAESVKVIQGRVAHGTLYVRLTYPTMDNRHNKPRSSSRILTVRNFKFNLSTF